MTGGAADAPRIHAAIVHLPVGAWAGAVTIHLVARVRDADTLAGIDTLDAATALVRIGLAAAVVAAIAGLVEYSRLPDNDSLLRRAMSHMLFMGAASGCFLLLALDGNVLPDLPPIASDLLFVGGGVLLLAGGHHGGRLVPLRYRLGGDRTAADKQRL